MDARESRIYTDTKELFPEDSGDKRFLYVRKNWIFPNHIDIIILNAHKLANKYEGNEQICFYGALLHDVGLAYKRTSSSAEGHEERSIEFATKILKENEYDDEFIQEVIKCIIATEANKESESINAKIVRTADALAQFESMHFFAKSAFSNNIEFFAKWFGNKVESNFSKLMFEEEK